MKYNNEPWPSTYESLGEREPKNLVSRFGREVGAFRSAFPAYTVEPPQIHLTTARDGQPFEELITEFEFPFHVLILNPLTGKTLEKEYIPGQNIIIPEYIIHWLVNRNSRKLELTCEYAPHPWDGEGDEPEFPNLKSLWAFIEERELRAKVNEASSGIDRIMGGVA